MFSLLQDFLILSRAGRLELSSEANEPYSMSSYGAVVELEAGKDWKDLIENILISGPNLAISLHGKIN